MPANVRTKCRERQRARTYIVKRLASEVMDEGLSKKHALLYQLNLLESLRFSEHYHQDDVPQQFSFTVLVSVIREFEAAITEELGPVAFEQMQRQTSIEYVCAPPYYSRHAGIYRQRRVKLTQRNVAQKQARKPKRLLQEPKYDPELVLEQKVRTPHRHGFLEEYRPTRDRYWIPRNENWKESSRSRKQWQANL